MSAAEMKRHMRSTVPEYMIPSVIVDLDEMPLNHNGKVDRARLVELAVKGIEHEPSEVPRNVVEELVGQTWSVLLGIGRVGRDENFFDIGGLFKSDLYPLRGRIELYADDHDEGGNEPGHHENDQHPADDFSQAF